MSDRISSDHPSVTTVRARLGRLGTTSRPALQIPDEAAEEFPTDDPVRLVLDGDERYALAVRDFDGNLVVRGVYDSPTQARDPGDAPNRLVEWVSDAGVKLDSSVHLDVVEPGFLYGVRAPGERAIYEPKRPPNDGLASIARDLDDQ